jgi:hypothetical protein
MASVIHYLLHRFHWNISNIQEFLNATPQLQGFIIASINLQCEEEEKQYKKAKHQAENV